MSADPLDQLRKLAALKEEGLLDDEEYARLKRQFLAQAAGTNEAPLPPAPPLGNPASRAPRISETEVAELHARLLESEQAFSTLQTQRADRIETGHKLRRRLRHLARIAWARSMVKDFIGAPLTPIVVMTSVGVVLGVMILELISSIPNAMLIGGLSGGIIALLTSFHVFVTPTSVSIERERSSKENKLVAVERELAREEPAFVDAGANLNALRREYETLEAEYKSARNHFLSLEWRAMRGEPFEVFLKDVLEHLGYRCQLTRRTGDQGIDIIAEKDNTRIAIQVKAFATSVGNESVQQACAGMRHYGCNRCAVITNSRFTPAAIQLARSNDCKLVDETQIEPLIMGEVAF